MATTMGVAMATTNDGNGDGKDIDGGRRASVSVGRSLCRGAITLPAVAMPRIFISMLATDKVKDKDKSAYAMPMTSTSQNKALSIVNKSLG